MYIYHFYNRLFVNEVRTIITSFPVKADMLSIYAATIDNKGWFYSQTLPEWWRK